MSTTKICAYSVFILKASKHCRLPLTASVYFAGMSCILDWLVFVRKEVIVLLSTSLAGPARAGCRLAELFYQPGANFVAQPFTSFYLYIFHRRARRESAADAGVGPVLCHGDFHMWNVAFGEQQRRVRFFDFQVNLERIFKFRPCDVPSNILLLVFSSVQDKRPFVILLVAV